MTTLPCFENRAIGVAVSDEHSRQWVVTAAPPNSNAQSFQPRVHLRSLMGSRFAPRVLGS